MRILPALLAAAGALCAQNKPVTGCADLRSLTSNQITVAVAQALAETPQAPAHCRVFGQVLPHVGFEVRMPAEWNGRFVMIGNGGDAGEPTDLKFRSRNVEFFKEFVWYMEALRAQRAQGVPY